MQTRTVYHGFAITELQLSHVHGRKFDTVQAKPVSKSFNFSTASLISTILLTFVIDATHSRIYPQLVFCFFATELTAFYCDSFTFGKTTHLSFSFHVCHGLGTRPLYFLNIYDLVGKAQQFGKTQRFSRFSVILTHHYGSVVC